MQHKMGGLSEIPLQFITASLYSDWLFFLYIFSMFAHVPRKQMTIFSSLLPRFLAIVLVFLCMCQRTWSGQALEKKKMNGNESAYSLISLDLAERDLDDSSISGYPTDIPLPSLDEICCSSSSK